MKTLEKVYAGHYKNPIQLPTWPKPSEWVKVPLGCIHESQLQTALADIARVNEECRKCDEIANKYREEDAKITTQFENDLAVEFGVENNPKRGTLWAKVWERSHAGGFQDLASDYANLVELIKD